MSEEFKPKIEITTTSSVAEGIVPLQVQQPFPQKIREIRDEGDAQKRLKDLFGDDLEYLENYAEFLGLLASPLHYEKALCLLSQHIWEAYNSFDLIEVPNRYSRSIARVASSLGFATSDILVLTEEAEPRDFGDLIENRLLWKDSFTLGHGEFSHSYQWLAAGLYLKWGGNTAIYYQSTRGKLSVVPFWCKAGGSKLVLQPAKLWEYLVDCTQLNSRHGTNGTTAKEYIERNIISICEGAKTVTVGRTWVRKMLTGDGDGFSRSIKKPIKIEILLERFEEIKKDRKIIEIKDEEEKRNTTRIAIIKFCTPQIVDLQKVLVENFQICNLFSNSTINGGSFRNANNVSDLARDVAGRRRRFPEIWFITAYETRRVAKLLKSQNTNFTHQIISFLRKPHQISGRQCIYNLKKSVVVKMGLMQREEFISQILGWEKHTSDSLTEISNLFWTLMQEHQASIVVMSAEQLKADNGDLFDTPMTSLSNSRIQHYSIQIGTVWNVRVSGIFQQDISGTPNRKMKNQIRALFHGIEGCINEFKPL